MGKDSKIEWTTNTFNPWWGCVRVSAGCVHCYAETFSKRLGNDIWGVNTPRKFMSDKYWSQPVKWNKEAAGKSERTYVFCASMADWLEDREDLIEPRARLCKLIEDTPYLTWLLLTKRIENALDLVPKSWISQGAPRNAWFGVTTENQASYDKRIDDLVFLRQAILAEKIWLSIEPQITGINLHGNMVDWVICGGESGHGAREFKENWGRSLLKQCRELGIPFFMKQLGGNPDKRHNLEQFPEDLRVREFPHA